MTSYANFTDDQLQEWHENRQRIDRLTADLAESRKATEAVQAAAEVERSKLLGELSRSDLTVLNLTTKLAGQQSANRRLCGEQVQLVKALRALHDACTTVDCCGACVGDVDGFAKAQRDAAELLSLLEVPFG